MTVTPRTYRQYAGYRSCVRNQRTHTIVAVVDGAAAGWDTDTGDGETLRWYTSCETHGTIIFHRTLQLARYHAASPESWCEDCARLLD
jgi:hypothetical protein